LSLQTLLKHRSQVNELFLLSSCQTNCCCSQCYFMPYMHRILWTQKWEGRTPATSYGKCGGEIEFYSEGMWWRVLQWEIRSVIKSLRNIWNLFCKFIYWKCLPECTLWKHGFLRSSVVEVSRWCAGRTFMNHARKPRLPLHT
jgi:hypothetical protein